MEDTIPELLARNWYLLLLCCCKVPFSAAASAHCIDSLLCIDLASALSACSSNLLLDVTRNARLDCLLDVLDASRIRSPLLDLSGFSDLSGISVACLSIVVAAAPSSPPSLDAFVPGHALMEVFRLLLPELHPCLLNRAECQDDLDIVGFDVARLSSIACAAAARLDVRPPC